MRMALISLGFILALVLITLLFMRLTCTGLWEPFTQVSKVPYDLMSASHPSRYTRRASRYIGWKACWEKWRLPPQRKQQILARLRDPGVSRVQVAEETGLSEFTLSRWQETAQRQVVPLAATPTVNAPGPITRSDLVAIRQVAIEHYTRSRHEFKTAFLNELTNGELLIGERTIQQGTYQDPKIDVRIKDGRLQDQAVRVVDGEAIGIGAWKLEPEEGQYRLIRYGDHRPDASAIFNFGVRLERDQGHWRVIKEFYEHVRVRPQ